LVLNAQGKLTNLFADAISFMVKSTNPSYVGGDVWGTEEALGLANTRALQIRYARRKRMLSIPL
jgi:hypothetical protein